MVISGSIAPPIVNMTGAISLFYNKILGIDRARQMSQFGQNMSSAVLL